MYRRPDALHSSVKNAAAKTCVSGSSFRVRICACCFVLSSHQVIGRTVSVGGVGGGADGVFVGRVSCGEGG